MLLPQTPMPVATVYATAPASTSVPAPEIANSTHQTRDGVHAGAEQPVGELRRPATHRRGHGAAPGWGW